MPMRTSALMISTFSVSVTTVGAMLLGDEELLDGLTRARAGLEQHERLAREILRRDLLSSVRADAAAR